jgi:hypothetical protein
MACVRGEAVPEVFGCAPDLEVFSEPFGEFLWRERLVLDAFRICVDRR